MTKTEKCLLAVGGAGSTALVLAIAAVNIPRGPVQASQPPQIAQTSQPAPKTQAISVPLPAALPPSPSIAAKPLAPLPPGATSIPDEYLVHLSEMVALDTARDHPLDKAQWKQAVAIAGKLMAGPCDCGQRNWLSHFVEMGNHALANETDQFNESAQVLASLGRNDKQEMAMLHRP